MDKFTLLMVLHSHQPVGNFDHVFEYAVKRCYRPVVEMLARYPDFRCGLHFTGPLLSWLEIHDQSLLRAAASLCQRGQVEMLSGGYYEPLLAVIPQQDAVAQLDKQTAYTEKRFGQKPRGFWLAERIWEPGLPAKLSPCGLDYTLVDDTHLYYAGLGPEHMFGYHLTEREGAPLALFPTHKQLRYTIPFQEPEKTLDFLHQALDEYGPTCATYGDDSEKFGLWPGTYEWVFEKGWLERFIEAVLSAGDWLQTGLPSEFLDGHPPKGRVYLPTASYEEMLTWALPAQASLELERLIKELQEKGEFERMRKFLRGGIWDNFLIKYRESNLMHKRMLFVSRKLREQTAPADARDHLYQAQCNCAYWHGLFGGLYLGHLRHAVHEHLIAAESICDYEKLGESGWARSLEEDIDLDGRDEVVLANSEMDLLIHPAMGGSVSLFSLRKKYFNLAGALTRRQEVYHAHFEDQPQDGQGEEGPKSIHDQVVFKEEGLKDYLIYDWYERAMFQDHFLPRDAGLDDYLRAKHREWGDFISEPYELKQHYSAGGRACCELRRNGSLWAPGGPWPLAVEKSFCVEGSRLELEYLIELGGETPPPCLFGVEINFSLLSEQDPGKYVELIPKGRMDLNKPLESGPVERLALVNRGDGFKVEIEPSQPARVWCFPVETVSQSESGLERTYQGSSLTLLWDLEPGSSRISLSIKL